MLSENEVRERKMFQLNERKIFFSVEKSSEKTIESESFYPEKLKEQKNLKIRRIIVVQRVCKFFFFWVSLTFFFVTQHFQIFIYFRYLLCAFYKCE